MHADRQLQGACCKWRVCITAPRCPPDVAAVQLLLTPLSPPQAPERHEAEAEEEFNGPAADMFSVGCTLFRMLAGDDPFNWNDPFADCDELMDAIEEGRVPFDECQPPLEVTRLVKELIGTLLAMDPAVRPTAKMAARHDWFTSNDEATIELASRLLAEARVVA